MGTKAILAVIVGCGLLAGASGARQDRQGDLKVFLFAGQSNMAGADALVGETGERDLAAFGAQTEADRRALFTYGPAFSEEQAGYYPWGDIRGHRGSSRGRAGFYIHGPEVGFARTLHAAGVAGVAIVKVANNFSALENLRSPWVKPGGFYAGWRAFVARRLAQLGDMGRSWTVAGFVWHQGIDDAILRRSQADYESDLKQIIADLRSEYGTPRAPFVLARSVNSEIAGTARMTPIRAGQVAVADSDPMADWIDVDDLAPYVNRHHLTAAAQVRAGERFAKAYLYLVDPNRPGGGKLSAR